MNTYESTLNTWLADALSNYGLDATPESGQGGGRRIDVEVVERGIKIALEAEQGLSATKKASAIKDADRRIVQRLAPCAIAVCYPDGLRSAGDLASSEVQFTLRTINHRPVHSNAEWTEGSLRQLVGFIRRVPDQLGDPDNIANILSNSLVLAVRGLSESQKKDLVQSLDLISSNEEKKKADVTKGSRLDNATQRAFLVIATAIMFQARLDSHRHEITTLWDQRFTPPRSYEGEWPPDRATDCVKHQDPIGAFDKAWDLWQVVDYKPIFATGRSALYGCAQDTAFNEAVRGVANAAIFAVRSIAGLRHDLLGRIFHKVLDTARYDGSFYTSTAAATLLANLAITDDVCDWSSTAVISQMRITDPACGTGTLLMAAAERIRDLTTGALYDRVSRALIENVLTGYDANLTATHLAAATLGLLSPTTTFKEMKIGRALLGVEDGKAYLGSLEFLSEDGFPQMMPWPTGVEQVESSETIDRAEHADVVIMNPPFTVNSLRHQQFSGPEKNALKQREQELFAGQPVHLSSNGNTFLVLANYIAKSGSGVVASVLPLATATNASALEIRKFMAKNFHVETIITSHDPVRKFFSENTTITEMLLVCRRWPRELQKPATRFINLYENPATPNEAASVAKHITEGRKEKIKGSVQAWSPERVEAGNWGAVQFFSPFLCERFLDLKLSQLFLTRELGQLTTISPDGRGIRAHFMKSDVPDSNAMTALYDHKTSYVQSMTVGHDMYIVPRKGREKQAANLWEKRGTLLLAMRARLNTVRLLCVRLPYRTLGSAWVPCKPSREPFPQDTDYWVETVEKAICAYLNSTFGILAMLGNRSVRDLSYSQLSMDDLRKVSVPDFATIDRERIISMASAYDTLCETKLLPLAEMEDCGTRNALDEVIIVALDANWETVASIRRELVREPSVTGKPYEYG